MKSGTLKKKVRASSYRLALTISLIIVANMRVEAAINISPADAQRIAKRIWQNECGGNRLRPDLVECR